jgi:hypothetical protein
MALLTQALQVCRIVLSTALRDGLDMVNLSGLGRAAVLGTGTTKGLVHQLRFPSFFP